MQARILVVDDEKFIVEAISQHLTQLGHEVRSFLDPSEALLAIKSEPIDLVLTDLRMPDVSGMDITRAVYDRGEDTRVVILTGYATLDSAIESVHLQVYAYLNKPFDLRQLGQVVERALTEQRLERENKQLTEKISNMLSDITTLYEVSRLIYDTDDFDMTLEFVLDTLSIGLGISHSVLITKTSSGEYSIAKANMPESSKIAGVLEKVP
ncbi:MAG: response regulator, partial [Candidatus Marinimicrobia bacterium]|nr:response regulator [Candidatus Neomarinimicrobiota bacterium]